MTPSQIDIARQLVAAEECEWASGMQVLVASGLFRLTGYNGGWLGVPRDDPDATPHDLGKPWKWGRTIIPDLTDPATGGLLLAAFDVTVEAGYIAPSKVWRVTLWIGDGLQNFEGSTLAEACARALLAGQSATLEEHPLG